MSLIVTLIVYFVILGLVYYCVTLLPLPSPFSLIVRILFVLLAIYILLSAFGIVSGGLPRINL